MELDEQLRKLCREQMRVIKRFNGFKSRGISTVPDLDAYVEQVERAVAMDNKAQYAAGYLRGVAEALNVTVSTLMEECS